MPYPSPFYPCLCCHFLASFRLRINTEKDHIDIYFSVVDQGIKVILPDVFKILTVMQLSHLPRFDHDWYRGLHRGPIGTIVSNLIRSHHILISIVIIGLIVEKFFGCQKFCHHYHDWRDYRDHRIRSYDIVTNRNKSYLILFLNRGDRDRPKHRDLLR